MQDELVRMEEAFWEAAGDGDFYRENFAEDGHCVFGFGVLDKAQTIASIESASPWTAYEFADIAVTPVDDGVAILTYSVSAVRGDEDYQAMISSVYQASDDGWTLVLHQQTPATT